MYVKVLYDNEAKRGLLSGRGFSCLVEGKILFDTGEASHSLVENMDRMMVSATDLEGVVISHDEWDHTSGLWELLKRKKGLKVYICPSFSDTFKQCVGELGGKLVMIEGMTEISENIYVTGDLGNKDDEEKIISEQALVVKGDKGVSVITGCAQSGLIKLLNLAKKKMSAEKIYMVFGGFHLEGLEREEINKLITELRNVGVEKTGPTHCSGDKARRIFSGKFLKNYIAVKAGHIIHL